jgi:hypothetical protein
MVPGLDLTKRPTVISVFLIGNLLKRHKCDSYLQSNIFVMTDGGYSYEDGIRAGHVPCSLRIYALNDIKEEVARRGTGNLPVGE